MAVRVLFFYLIMISSAAFAGGKSTPIPIRYVALGDSYTLGTGAQMDEAWPELVTARLNKKGVPIQLAGNLGHNGWTTQRLIDSELPQLKQLKPDVVTLLIGANDWVRGEDAKTFQENVEIIINELLKIVSKPKHILIVTIPDFSSTPAGKEFSNGRDITKGIKEFNQILSKEAHVHSLKVVDICPLSQKMGKDPSLRAGDDLHPSAKEYAKWADLIAPDLKSLLRK
jgi:lysophospholipase L1-like esterase